MQENVSWINTVLFYSLPYLHCISESSAGFAAIDQAAVEGIHHQPRSWEAWRPYWYEHTLRSCGQESLCHAHETFGHNTGRLRAMTTTDDHQFGRKGRGYQLADCE